MNFAVTFPSYFYNRRISFCHQKELSYFPIIVPENNMRIFSI